MAECEHLRRFAFIWVWMYFLVCMECEDVYWNGCIGTKDLEGTNLCYKIQMSVDGVSAWKQCSSLQLLPDFRTSPAAQMLLNKLRTSDGTSGSAVWVGGIQTYFNASFYTSYDGSLTTPDVTEDLGDDRGCLALDPSGGFKLIGRNCSEELQMLCVFRKFEGVLHNAEADEACNFTNAVVLEPLDNCYKAEDDCKKTLFVLHPKSLEHSELSSDKAKNWHHIKTRHPIDVNMVKMKYGSEVFENTNATVKTGTQFCLKSNEPPGNKMRTMRLELRHNKTAGGLTLWMSNPGRAVWPPKCVGGRVKDPEGDPRALFISPLSDRDASPVIWCYVKDVLRGTIAFSNSVMKPGLPERDLCSPTDGDTGSLLGAAVDEKASCLRCLKYALSACLTDDCDEATECKETSCGHFGITLDEWEKGLNRSDGFEGLKKCGLDEICAGEAFWELTDGKDCNGDGILDCDDRITRVFDGACNGTGTDSREEEKGELYWECRSNPRSDFVDVLIEGKATRYFCENDMPKERRWAPPVILDKMSPYIVSSTTPPPTPTTPPPTSTTPTIQTLIPTPTTLPLSSSTSAISSDISNLTSTILPSKTPKPLTQKQAARKLEVLKLSIKPNISKNEMKEVINEVSALLGQQALLKAQSEANVTSVAELLENILVHAPDDLNLTTGNLAVSKERAIGFQLLVSKDPTGKGDTFGSDPKQVPIRNEKELKKYESEIEAAVLLPDLPAGVSLVVVTFAKSDDFIPCKRPRDMNSTTASSDSTPSHKTSDTANETADVTSMDVSEKYCPQGRDIAIGCVNSHIVQVGLISNNGSYQGLPDGKHVDLLLRTKTNTILGQEKICVSWNPNKKGWTAKGCYLIKQQDGLDTCRCTHLTHFAQLVSDGGAVSGPNAEALRIMSVCACVVSLFALSGVLTAAAFATKWRRKKENKVIVNLAVALTLYMSLFLWSAFEPRRPLQVRQCAEPEKPSVECQARGAALHYFVLSSFCWMLVAAGTHYLRFTTLTGISGVSRFLLKAMLIGWGAPIVPMAVVLAVQAEIYAGKGRDFCYPSGAAFYAAVLAPICAVLLANVVLFVLILRRLFPRWFTCKKDDDGPRRAGFNVRREFVRKLIVCVAFIFLFGFTWYVGLLSFAEVPAFFFCFVVMCQGPALFGFFVLGEESVRNRLKSVVRRRIASRDQYSSETLSTNVSGPSSRNRPNQMLLSSHSFNSSPSTTPLSEELPLPEMSSQ